MSWVEIASLFQSCGIARSEFLTYSIPFIHAVTPKLLEARLSQFNPFSCISASGEVAQSTENKTTGDKKTPTIQEIQAAAAQLHF